MYPKKNTLLALLMTSLIGSTFAVQQAAGEEIFSHTFDEESAKKRTADGFSIFGAELAGSAVTKREFVSRPNSACITVDMAQDTWGDILLKDEDMRGNTLDLRDATLSVKIKSSSSFAGSELGVVGFKLIDADGTENRTDEFDLFKPTSTFAEFKQHVSDLYFIETPGSDPALDLKHIARYAIVIYDKNDKNKKVTFYLDDFKAAREGIPGL